MQRCIKTHSKINAWLQVLPKTATGQLHEIISVFLPLEAGDLLMITACPSSRDSFRLTSNRPDLVPENSLESAWHVFLTATEAGTREGHFALTVHLEKRMPEQTGLGAGSGDAGAFLTFLNQLYSLPLSGSELCTAALHVGSDVPFFLEARPGIVRGTGGRMTPLDHLPPLACCIVLPAFRISTRDAFARLDTLMAAEGCSRAVPSIELEATVAILQGTEQRRQLPGELLNSFETILAGQNGATVNDLKRRFLEQGALLSGLSGSGSAVYGIYATRAAACAAALVLAGDFPGLQILTTDVL